MPTQIQLTFRAAPLPTNFDGTVQDFADAFVARLTAQSANNISFFASGPVMPTSNVGPWLKNNITWYVWSDTLATYVPETLEFESLRYIAKAPNIPSGTISTTSGSGAVVGTGTSFLTQFTVGDYISAGAETHKITAIADNTNMTTEVWNHTFTSIGFISKDGAPDQSKYVFWIELNNTGDAVSVRYFSSGAWRDIYASKFDGIFTKSETTALITTTVDAFKFNYPFIASNTGQVIPADGIFHKIDFTTEVIDPDSVYDAPNSKYLVPFNGIYRVSATTQIDNVDADPSTLEFSTIVVKNGLPGFFTAGTGTDVPSPTGSRWFPSFSSLVVFAQNDFVELWMSGADSTNTKTVSVSNSSWSIMLERKL